MNKTEVDKRILEWIKDIGELLEALDEEYTKQMENNSSIDNGLSSNCSDLE